MTVLRIFYLTLIITCLCVLSCFSQSKYTDYSNLNLRDAYQEAQIESKTFFSVENRSFRSNVDFLYECISSDYYVGYDTCVIVLTQRGVSQVSIEFVKTDSSLTIMNVSNEIPDEFSLYVKYDKAGRLKPKFIIYPQLSLQNVRLSQIYEVQLNIAPSFEIELAKGLKFQSQIIIPLYNDLRESDNYIRAGFITLSKKFRIKNIWGDFSIGKFNRDRYGVSLNLRKRLSKTIDAKGEVFYTGYSHIWKNNYTVSGIDNLSGWLGLCFFEKHFQLYFEAYVGQFLEQDRGIRFNLSRYFNDSNIGFYAVYAGAESNGGFSFTIPLAKRKKRKIRKIQIEMSKYFDWEYKARMNNNIGLSVENIPNNNKIEYQYNSLFIECRILKMIQNENKTIY